MNKGRITRVLLFCVLVLCIGIAIVLVMDMGEETEEDEVGAHTHDGYVIKAGDTMTGDLHSPNLYASGVIYGNGSGLTDLNADTLDGLDSTAFAMATHAHDDRYYTKALADNTFLIHTNGILSDDLRVPSLYASGVINGDGSGLINLNASRLTMGTIASARLPSNINADTLDGLDSSTFAMAVHAHDSRYYTETEGDSRYLKLLGGTLSGDLNLPNLYASGMINGDGRGLMNLNASRLTIGTIASARLPANIDADTLDGLDSVTFAMAAHSHDSRYYQRSEVDANFLNLSGGSLTGDLYLKNLSSSGVINGDGSGLGNMNASNITTGTIDPARLPPSFLKTYDSGWFAVTTNTEYLKTHNLGTTLVGIWLYYSSDNSGTDMQMVDATYQHEGVQNSQGGVVQAITTTTCKISTGTASIVCADVDGNDFAYKTTNGYYRLIMLALE
jgi:hypothetical protein